MSTKSRKSGGAKKAASTKAKRGDVEILAGKSSKTKKAGAKTPEISAAEVDAAKPVPEKDDLDSPGFTVTLTGSLPKVFCAIVVKKTGIRAPSQDAAVARFVQDLGGQFKKSEFFAIETCVAVETDKPKAPRLPFQKGEESKKDGAPKADAQPIGERALAGGAV